MLLKKANHVSLLELMYLLCIIYTKYFSLFTYEWPGSKAGCDCRNITRGIINATVSNKSKNI